MVKGVYGYNGNVKPNICLQEKLKRDLENGESKELATKAYNNALKEKEAELLEVVKENTEKIRSAKFDHKNCNKEFAKYEMQKFQTNISH